MKRFEAIEREIAARWGEDPAVHFCRSILDFTISAPSQDSLMLTYGDMKKITGASYEQDELQRAITILVSRFGALEMRLIFFDEDEGPIYLEREEQRDFIGSGMLIHPHNGKPVIGADEKLFPYYVANPSVLLEEVRT